MSVRRLIPAFLALLLVVSGQGGARAIQVQARNVAAPSALTVVMAQDAVGLDPQAVEDNSAGFIDSCVLDQLVEYKKGTTNVGPGLATKWNISKNGKVYTFFLRRGVKFQDGTAFNAKAYIRDLDRLVNPNNPNYVLKQAGVSSFISFTYGLVKSYKATGPYTVRITLKNPFGPFLSSLAMVWSGVMSPQAVSKTGDAGVLQHPVGTGPYRFVEWIKNDHITLEANPSYWGHKPKIKRITFQIVPDASVRVLKLKRGEAQIDADVTTQDVLSTAHTSGVIQLKQPGQLINGIGITTDVKPLNDVRVRQALNYAVDRKALSRSLFKGVGAPMNSYLPPPVWSYDKSLKGYPYNPNKAKQLLKAAGYPNGFSVELLGYTNPRGYNSAGGQLAVAVQQYLKAIGVQANITTMDFGAFLTKTRSGTYRGLYMTGWSGDNGDPDDFLYELFSSEQIPVGNTAHLRDAHLDAVLNHARQTSKKATRIKLYRQAQAILNHDAPWIFGTYTKQVRLTTSKVHGYALNPTLMFFYMQNVTLS
ncbi:MAG: ABC transporter substrate-binding protein [Chloroflexota bacterium]